MTKRLKERFDTLSDAIIAIVMTILVLEIKLPTSMAGLPHFAYAVGLFLVSFVIIFNFWYRRTIIMSVAEEVTYDAFARDVIAHMMLSLFPLATKMLVEFDQKWVPILFFGLINFVTAFLMSWITLNLTVRNAKAEHQEQLGKIKEFYKNRMIMIAVTDLLTMVVALLFNQVGIFIFLLSPFVEFWSYYKRGVIFETFEGQGGRFEHFIEEKERGRSEKRGFKG
ncbi:TMEM175 family protein [Streptococcus gallinaceus]|uniref:Membrane protein n=1 Tax=Streptococcus gallinaceus TaxID=165758 RepID=A0ABV2JN30_9STRE